MRTKNKIDVSFAHSFVPVTCIKQAYNNFSSVVLPALIFIAILFLKLKIKRLINGHISLCASEINLPIKPSSMPYDCFYYGKVVEVYLTSPSICKIPADIICKSKPLPSSSSCPVVVLAVIFTRLSTITLP